MLISKAVLAFAVSVTVWAGKPWAPTTPFSPQTTPGNQNQISSPSTAKASEDHNAGATAAFATNGPYRWVCVGKLKARPAVTVETKGSMNGSCDGVTKKTLKDLGVLKAGNTSPNPDQIPAVPADEADVYCRKEEFQISCQ